ncbi:MAG: D-alanyl-D-alanine carboxypeptidase/D-alanyl-D-alanine-endopeptidase [Acidobacteriaceae bacterium]|nr:D-alanyl-D-alanine carboxypeptidase/D-alanyl-D-alanine-endopeptidase [Acidobacteriaceae bacterium]
MSIRNLPRLCSIALIAMCCADCCAQTGTFEERVKAVMARPEFAHSRFGIELYALDTARPVYTLSEQELFVPGSTTKLLTEGTALEVLGGEYRFHTRIYRTGPIKGDTLDGDLVLVASGDPNLSNRIQPDETLVFENEDHSYGGPDSKGLPGDRLAVIRELARQVAAKGIKKIGGRVLVDSSLFPEGERELGTDVVLSPIVVNDNVVDVIATPGASEGAPVSLEVMPQTAYVKIVNKAVTGKAGVKSSLDYKDDLANHEGTRTVTLAGGLGVGARPEMISYRVPEPSRFAAVVLQEALRDVGVQASAARVSDKPDFRALAKSYTTANMVAEHVSAPLKEEVKVTLKVSQNLHASMTPYLLGALVAKKTDGASQAGFDVEHDLLSKAGLDLTAASQSDGAGGNAFFTPDFMVHYLLWMSKQKDFEDFYRGLPI